MNKTTILKVLAVVLVSSLIFIAYIWSLASKPNPKKYDISKFSPPALENSPSPTASSLDNSALQPSLSEQDLVEQKILNQLPFITAAFKIEYFANPPLYLVTIKQNPFEENVKTANQWFLDQGLKDLDSLNI